MRFTFLATLTLIATALAAPAAPAPAATMIPNGGTCTKDGSMGICQSNFCLQDASAQRGTCQNP